MDCDSLSGRRRPNRAKCTIVVTKQHPQFEIVSLRFNAYIVSAMQSFSRHTFSVLALLMYCMGGALIEVAHHDEMQILLQSHPVLESHDCGAKEFHLSVEDARQCFACSQFAQRLSTESRTTHTFCVPNVGVVYVPDIAGQVLDTDILHSGKRGPPASAA